VPENFDKIEKVVSVNCDQSFDQMIVASHCVRKHCDISSTNFPIVGVGKRDVRLFLVCLRRYVLISDVERNLEILGLKPARIEHSLALGAECPNEQVCLRTFVFGSGWVKPIITLGSVWINSQGECVAPCLTEHVGKRVLDLVRVDPSAPLDGSLWFLAINKNELTTRLSLAC